MNIKSKTIFKLAALSALFLGMAAPLPLNAMEKSPEEDGATGLSASMQALPLVGAGAAEGDASFQETRDVKAASDQSPLQNLDVEILYAYVFPDLLIKDVLNVSLVSRSINSHMRSQYLLKRVREEFERAQAKIDDLIKDRNRAHYSDSRT